MIKRYSRPEMAKIWDENIRYQKWLEVELSVCRLQTQEGWIPKKDGQRLCKKLKALLKDGGVKLKRVEFHEQVVRHDVIAFTTVLAELIGPLSRYVHFGLTSSDVVDTAFSLQIQDAGRVLVSDIQILLKNLKKLAMQYRDLPTIGRSHGIFAEPTSFGLKFLSWYMEWKRNLKRIKTALEEIRFGKLSGAVGVNPHFGPEFERKVLAALKLKRESVSTQVLPRDRHANLLNVLALCGSSLERIAVELRHLQRSEVGEVLEGFGTGQKGSSAMPHKRNPISSENLTGCARMLRAYAQGGLENIALWHERDISHSSVERVFFPDAMILLDYALHRMSFLLEQLIIRREAVQKNLEEAGGVVFSGHFLLELVKAGASREEAYAWVQQCAHQSLDQKIDFIKCLSSHAQIRALLGLEKIKTLSSLSYQLRNVSRIYQIAFRE